MTIKGLLYQSMQDQSGVPDPSVPNHNVAINMGGGA